MYKTTQQPAALPHVSDFLLQAGRKRRTNTVQASVSKLYDKSKNSYSKKFQMKMQLMNQPRRPLENTMKTKLGASTVSIQYREPAKVHQRGDSVELARTGRSKQRDDDRNHQFNRSLEVRIPQPEDQQISNLNNSGFIRIQGEQAYLEGIETKQMLFEQYKQIIRQIEKVKQNCENEQTKLKNADEALKAKKKLLAEERKELRVSDRPQSELQQLEKALLAQKQQIMTLITSHESTMTSLQESLNHLQQLKQTQLDKLEYIDKVKLEQQQKLELSKQQATQMQKLRSEQVILLREKQELESENYQNMETLTKLKAASSPPFDIHRKYIEKLEKLIMLGDMERVEGYVQGREDSKNNKKLFQKAKEELARKKDESADVKKKLDEKRKQSQKYQKQMKQKAAMMMELSQKLL